VGKINNYQLLTLTVVFTIGGTTVFNMGSEAKRDSWLAIIVGLIMGTVYLWLFVQLQNIYPDKNLVDITFDLLGKIIGAPLVFLVVLQFIYQSSRSFRDYGELIVTTFLEDTPLLVIHIVFMLLMCYVIYLGYETLARTNEILTPIFILFFLITYLLIIITGKVNFSELTPVLAEGFSPVIKTAYRKLVMWPYGEIVVFLMFWKYAENKNQIFKISFISFIISTFIITSSSIIILSTLGLDYGSTIIMSLIEVIRNISIGGVLTNLDAIGILILFIGGFYKTIIYFLGGILAFAALFKIKDYRWLIIPFGVFTVWFSVIFEGNYPYHIWLGWEVTLLYSHPIFILIIPILLLLIALLKKNTDKATSKALHKRR